MRRFLALLGLAVLAVLAAGCGGGTVAAGPDLTSFATAARASAASDTGRFELDVELTLPGAETALRISASGAFDTPSRRSQLSFDMSALAKLLAGFTAGLGGTSGGELPTDPESWRLEAIQDGDLVYLRFPLLADQLPEGKTWVRGNARELASKAGSGLDQFGAFAGTDPRDTFAYLKAVSGRIETVGGEKVRGAETTHYRATIDLARVTALLPKKQQQGLGSLDGLLGPAGLGPIPLDVWLDAEQRVRKLRLTAELADPTSDRKAGGSFTIELFDYGEPLELALPPAEEVVDASVLERK